MKPPEERFALEYSSEAEEHKREQQAEADRRNAIADYNQATFGERTLFAGTFLRLAITFVVIALLVFLLPRWIGKPLALLAGALFWVWERLSTR